MTSVEFSRICWTCQFAALCFLTVSVVGQENPEFGHPFVLSRQYPRNPNMFHDRYTPMYGLERTTNYPLYTTPTVEDRVWRNFVRCPELMLPLACLLCCVAWTVLACCVTFCCVDSYQCAMSMNNCNPMGTCLHWWLCCFVCHYARRAMKGKKKKKPVCDVTLAFCEDPAMVAKRVMGDDY